ncbi:aminodeoxychorismate lyase [Rhodococcus sp. MEB064]|uniref:aminodeoxychorismate lyase n=1 Tax=Rhodococcus sp. MEB064 TaxID=1587522 RepID=UPI0005AD05C7|nr:aminodeoxychorismate lyase [Rhodococcus sp. MEB064]KIQ18902.1 4-amino-4-deoxychorismate lyase [Rhodococcus sp. MEB064]
MTSRVVVTLDGVVQDPTAPVLHADDLGAVRGDGVFETILIRDGKACRLDAHLARLASSADMLDLDEPDAEAWRAAVSVAVAEWERTGSGEGAMRLYLSRGRESDSGGAPTALVTVSEVSERVARSRAKGVSAMTLSRGYSIDAGETSPWTLLGAKTLSYATNMAALRHAARAGVDDVVFRSTDGHVLEGPRSTVLSITGRRMVTPPVEHGVLRGTTVDALFEIAGDAGFSTEHAPLRVADLILADSVWLVSSVTLAARVHTLDSTTYRERPTDRIVRDLVDTAVMR